MKRIILGALGLLALVLLLAAILGGGSLDGAPRYLIGAGAVVLIIGVADGFRSDRLVPAGAGSTASPAASSTSSSAPTTLAAPAGPAAEPAATAKPIEAVPPAEATTPPEATRLRDLFPAAPPTPPAPEPPAPTRVIDLRDVIDLTDGETALVARSSLLEQFITDGLIRVVDGPISDDEVHAMVMVAIVDGESLGPRLADQPASAALVGTR